MNLFLGKGTNLMHSQPIKGERFDSFRPTPVDIHISFFYERYLANVARLRGRGMKVWTKGYGGFNHISFLSARPHFFILLIMSGRRCGVAQHYSTARRSGKES